MINLLKKVQLVKKNLTVGRKKKNNFFIKITHMIYLEKKIPFSVTDFRNDIKIKINILTKDDLILNINGLNLSFVNGIRRNLISEINAVCIDRVFFYHNSSFLDDEFLSHRLGLIPLLFVFYLQKYSFDSINNLTKKIIFQINIKHLFFSLKKCCIYSKSIKYKPYGVHSVWLKNLQIKPVFNDILVAKLNPGQKIKCECHCKFGKGNDHAKFSSVGTSFYRIFPEIKIVNEIINKYAKKIFKKCPVKVFKIKQKTKNNYNILFVLNSTYCTLCRECLNHKEEKKNIRIGRNREKITFVIESTGILSPEKLFHRAICLLIGKCNQSMLMLLKKFINKKI